MSQLSRRVQDITESATLAITTKAKRLRAEGKPVIGFGAGEPDFATPDHIVEAAARAVHDVATHRYSPAAGLPELRSAVVAKTKRDSGYEVDESQVVVTNGGKHAVYTACQTLLDPGDEVLLPSPYWVTYPEAIRLAGAVPVYVPTDASTAFRASVEQLDAALTEKTKLLIFVSPSNPTGSVYPPDEVAAIGAWAAERGIWVMTDEIYEHLVYGVEAVSMPVATPDIGERCVVVNGVAKSYAMTGWRVGWMIGPADVSAAAIRLQSHLTSNVANVSQVAAVAALTGDLGATHDMRRAFDQRRRTMVKLLNEIPGVECIEPRGAFYCFPNVSSLLGRSFAGRPVATSMDLAAALLDEALVAIVPGEPFGAPGYARLSFALSDDDLAEGLTRFRHFVESS